MQNTQETNADTGRSFYFDRQSYRDGSCLSVHGQFNLKAYGNHSAGLQGTS